MLLHSAGEESMTNFLIKQLSYDLSNQAGSALIRPVQFSGISAVVSWRSRIQVVLNSLAINSYFLCADILSRIILLFHKNPSNPDIAMVNGKIPAV